jgi:hypothetical protein
LISQNGASGPKSVSSERAVFHLPFEGNLRYRTAGAGCAADTTRHGRRGFRAKRTLTRCACCQTRRRGWAKQTPGGKRTAGGRRSEAARHAGKRRHRLRAVGRYCGHRTDWAASRPVKKKAARENPACVSKPDRVAIRYATCCACGCVITSPNTAGGLASGRPARGGG